MVMHIAASFMGVTARQCCMTVHLPIASLPRVCSPPRPAHSEASSSTQAEQQAAVGCRPKRSLQSTLHAFLKPHQNFCYFIVSFSAAISVPHSVRVRW